MTVVKRGDYAGGMDFGGGASSGGGRRDSW
jgi:hypothetical protein